MTLSSLEMFVHYMNAEVSQTNKMSCISKRCEHTFQGEGGGAYSSLMLWLCTITVIFIIVS